MLAQLFHKNAGFSFLKQFSSTFFIKYIFSETLAQLFFKKLLVSTFSFRKCWFNIYYLIIFFSAEMLNGPLSWAL